MCTINTIYVLSTDEVKHEMKHYFVIDDSNSHGIPLDQS